MSDTEKESVEVIEGHQVHTAEINFLKEVYDSHEIRAVELADRTKVTRSAVTQMSNKLEDRGYIQRYSKPDNKKEKYIKLSEFGENVLKMYDKKHKDANERMCDYINSLDDNQRETIMEFMINLQQCMPISNFECMGKRKEIKLNIE